MLLEAKISYHKDRLRELKEIFLTHASKCLCVQQIKLIPSVKWSSKFHTSQVEIELDGLNLMKFSIDCSYISSGGSKKWGSPRVKFIHVHQNLYVPLNGLECPSLVERWGIV